MNLTDKLNHLAIIPDGNRRWAKARLLLPWKGHIEGVKRFWELAEAAAQMGIKYLTFWAGSYGNLDKRSKEEVDVLFQLMADELAKPELLEKLEKNKTSLKVIGEWELFARDSKLKDTLQGIENKTTEGAEYQLTILFGYDGQREMLAAVKSLQQSGQEVNADNLQQSLWTKELPAVDLVIRTGGEPHWSAGFLMWQTANSQYYFTEDLWPDFKVPQLKTALEDFERRERRLGK
ncbi:di-trans,poly-cis-decaprenylcistransferase [bacterium]|nr:MAG: di-trans,poly-cis-decaprenylcistransferase [bacterium]